MKFTLSTIFALASLATATPLLDIHVSTSSAETGLSNGENDPCWKICGPPDLKCPDNAVRLPPPSMALALRDCSTHLI